MTYIADVSPRIRFGKLPESANALHHRRYWLADERPSSGGRISFWASINISPSGGASVPLTGPGWLTELNEPKESHRSTRLGPADRLRVGSVQINLGRSSNSALRGLSATGSNPTVHRCRSTLEVAGVPHALLGRSRAVQPCGLQEDPKERLRRKVSAFRWLYKPNRSA